MIIKTDTLPPACSSARSSSADKKDDSPFSALLNDRLDAGLGEKAPSFHEKRTPPADPRKGHKEPGDMTISDLMAFQGGAGINSDIWNLEGMSLSPSMRKGEAEIAEQGAMVKPALSLPGSNAPINELNAAKSAATRAAGADTAQGTESTQDTAQAISQDAMAAVRPAADLQFGSLQGKASRTGADLPSLSVPRQASPLGAALSLAEGKYSPILLEGETGTPAASEGINRLTENPQLAASELPTVKHEEPEEGDLLLSVQNAETRVVDNGTLSATSTPITRVINQPVGTPAWQHALSQQLSYFTRNGIHNAELRLHPEELGALQINLQLNNDRAQLHFVTANHQVRAAIEAAMPHLRTSLEESGISLGESSVGQDASSFRQAFQESDGTASHGRPHTDNEEPDGIILKEPATVTRVRHQNGINTFV